ncbi:MAG TPA: OstA-like protein [Cyclobacteriaceae bacterium]|nr:OstA-like protein [Cyclobacteriaceae bacterium]
MRKKTFLLILFFCGWGITLLAQGNTDPKSRLEIIQAEQLLGGKGFERLLDDVVMRHQNSMIYCDSAHFYGQQNLAKLFGNVRIEDPDDSVTTYSAYGEYDGNSQLAKLRTGVVFKNKETTLYTDFLDYHRSTGEANYFNSGKVVDSTNVLTSDKGLYQTVLDKITFTDLVVLTNPDYTLKSNVLVYNTVTKIAETEGITNIQSKEGNKLNARKGTFYDTEAKIFRFFDGDVETENSLVSAERLYYDENNQYYEASENVSVFHKERNVEIFGEEGRYWEDRKYSKVYGNALVQKYFEKDTLYMIADTLISQDSEDAASRYLQAFSNMRMIKSDLSGRSDSMVYTYSDSTIYLYGDPVLWNNNSQITADSIRFLIANEDIDRAFLKDNAFAVTRDTVLNFNQIRGRKMTGYFSDGQLNKLDVEGNGESLYYALENDTTLRGVNKLLCGRIIMSFEGGKVSRISHTIKPEASFTPPHMLKEEDTVLAGFTWREEERPHLEMIRAWRSPKLRPEDEFNFFEEPDVQLPYPDDVEIRERLENSD